MSGIEELPFLFGGIGLLITLLRIGDQILCSWKGFELYLLIRARILRLKLRRVGELRSLEEPRKLILPIWLN